VQLLSTLQSRCSLLRVCTKSKDHRHEGEMVGCFVRQHPYPVQQLHSTSASQQSACFSAAHLLHVSFSAGVQIALNSSLVTCFKCCGLGSDGPVTCLQACQGCLLASNAEGQLVRFAQQPNSSIWVEDKRVSMTGRVTSLIAAEDASQAVVGTSMGTIWYGQPACLLVSTCLH